MSTHTHNILGDLAVTVRVRHNPFRLPLEALFGMAARINKKRSFLFVSKVLGKHIPVDPHTPLLGGAALALLLARSWSGDAEAHAGLLEEAIRGLVRPEEAKRAYRRIRDAGLRLPVPVVFIGFAETATALGHSMYAALEGDRAYLHSTRERIPARRPLIEFEEEHSHAVAHRCYADDEALLAGEGAIVLVDDEITTGKTALNIIEELQAKFPRRRYVVASLLDWRSEEDERRFAKLEERLGISIETISLVKGTVEVTGGPVAEAAAFEDASSRFEPEIDWIYLDDAFELRAQVSENGSGERNEAPYLAGTGRFGIGRGDDAATDAAVARAAGRLSALRGSGRTLCLGTGEFMYVPMRIAAEMGERISYHSTTRSPVHCAPAADYAVRSGSSFPAPDDSSVTNYIYNIEPGAYEDLFLFFERDLPRASLRPMLAAFRRKGFRRIRVVVCGPRVHSEEEAAYEPDSAIPNR